MMPGPQKLEPSDAVLLRYLLGALPVDEAEPIEEASIVDEDLAARLNAMECDLVDSYVRSELEGTNLAKFQSWYLSSPLRARKVEAAKAIMLIVDGAEPGAVSVTSEAKAPVEANPPAAAKIAPTPTLSYGGRPIAARPGGARAGIFRTWPMLGFAAAVLILIVAVGFLTSRNKRLRNEEANVGTDGKVERRARRGERGQSEKRGAGKFGAWTRQRCDGDDVPSLSDARSEQRSDDQDSSGNGARGAVAGARFEQRRVVSGAVDGSGDAESFVAQRGSTAGERWDVCVGHGAGADVEVENVFAAIDARCGEWWGGVAGVVSVPG